MESKEQEPLIVLWAETTSWNSFLQIKIVLKSPYTQNIAMA